MSYYVGHAASTNPACYIKDATESLVQLDVLGYQLTNVTDHLLLGLSLSVLKHSSNAPGPVEPSRCTKDATKLRVQLHVPCYVGHAALTNPACYSR